MAAIDDALRWTKPSRLRRARSRLWLRSWDEPLWCGWIRRALFIKQPVVGAKHDALRHETLTQNRSLVSQADSEESVSASASIPRTLRLEHYAVQAARWPHEGRHILAHFDDATITLYQAYRPRIAKAAVADGRLGRGGFSFRRMSWIKPNFLWMMHRSGWATKEGQQRVLALQVSRTGFDQFLERAIPSSFDPKRYPDMESWRSELRQTEVMFQWDPDHAPSGEPLMRRALQIGLRGSALRALADKFLTGIEDITPFVEVQRLNRDKPEALIIPAEEIYPAAAEAELRIGVAL